MRHRNVLSSLFGIVAGLALASASRQAAAQNPFSVTDWLMHRGTPTRQGQNPNPGSLDLTLAGGKTIRPVAVWPPTADYPAEIVVDNTILPVPAPPMGVTQSFAVGTPGSWFYPTFNERAFGAWPPSAPTFDDQQDYVYAFARTSGVLRGLGVDILSRLPNLGTDPTIPDLADPTQVARVYKLVNDELAADAIFARWSFGTNYPLGTSQGRIDVSGRPLAPNQRYAVFIRFPNSGTFVGNAQTPHPNVDHAMVRVSWGANPNDPVTSRVFMVNAGQTGGFWMRVRTGPGDDRFFPYDGVNPITVTLYSFTPDDVNDQNLFGSLPLITADAVRLVPEAQRGDIHAPAVTAKFPLSQPDGPGRTLNLAYFGREETTGPPPVRTVAQASSTPPGAFVPVPFDPSLAPGPTNPITAEPTSSIRSAVFYCLEADLAARTFTRLRWRHVAQTTPRPTVTVDDIDGSAGFQATAGFQPPQVDPLAQAYGGAYHATPVTQTAAPQESAIWQAPIPATGNTVKPNESYSVYVWIPAGVGISPPFARNAHYIIDTVNGPLDVFLDQRNADDQPGRSKFGTWRRLASGIRFAAGSGAGTARITLISTSDTDFTQDPSRVVVADAVQVVAEAQNTNGIVAAPLVANIPWPDGITRSMVFFATTDGHVHALDALGVGGGSTRTTNYWVYPSISNPDPNGTALRQANAPPGGPWTPGALLGPEDDPNMNPEGPTSNRPNQGIDADLEKSSIPNPNPPPANLTVFVPTNKTPDLGAFVSSPVLVNVARGMPPAYTPLLVIGNNNGRLYAIDPVGRTGPGNGPFPATIAGVANLDDPGVPGTTRRVMTWPSTARDKWLRDGGTILGQNSFARYQDDAGKGVFTASPTANTLAADPLNVADRIIAGAGDGHVYCVDIQTLDTRERISNSQPGNALDGKPRWQYPSAQAQLDPVLQPGALSSDFSRFVFSAGGRVYCVNNPVAGFNVNAALNWVYPFTSAPPGFPNPGAMPPDLPPADNNFTAPALVQHPAVNGGVLTALVANRDGTIVALDATQINGAGPNVLWTSTSQGTTRASVVFMANNEPLPGFATGTGPAAILPLDNGAIIGVQATLGRMNWGWFDAAIGGVPVEAGNSTPMNPVIQPFPTSFAWRGADATISGSNLLGPLIYTGDEGNQDTGEMNGQVRIYGNEDIGMTTPGEPEIRPEARGVELRLVELWNAQRDDPTNMMDPTLVWERFGAPATAMPPPLSPYNERIANHQKPNTQQNVVIYEWGDTIYAAAWGSYYGTFLPQVTFTLQSGSTNRTVTVGATPDLAYNGPPLFINDGTMDVPAQPWVARYAFPLGRGNDADPQTPGRSYRVSASAQIVAGGGFSVPTFRLFAGQFDPPQAAPQPPRDPNDPANQAALGVPRTIVIAHPLALTTRSFNFAPTFGTAVPNIIGWENSVPVSNGTTNLAEIINNGNAISAVAGAVVTTTGRKDLVAPLGFINHGSSAAYTGVDNAGRPVPALFAADRSNLWKLAQTLSNVRIERRELKWGWNPTNAAQVPTGNVMNPLPWEQFPNTLPNVSLDYPDIDRTRATFRSDGIDMALRPVILARATAAGGVKTIHETMIDLAVDVPKFQPANVNRDYFDATGALNPGLMNGLMAPMVVTTGRDPSGGSLDRLKAASAGYVGQYVIYIDSNNDGRYQGATANGVQQVQQVTPTAREEVYRAMSVGIAVPPDINLKTNEETIDFGNVPHGMGYSPVNPFAPNFLGPYSAAPYASPWDQPAPPNFFRPFTVVNQGNVNLANVRVAKIIGDYTTNPASPIFWARLLSDQVEPLTNQPIWAVPFNPPVTANQGGVGFKGVVSSLDHFNNNPTAGFQTWDYDFYNSAAMTPGLVVPTAQDYVVAGNVLGWGANRRVRPTAHKPRPGDASGQTMSVPDVAYGDPLGLEQALKNFYTGVAGAPPFDPRPRIGVAIPPTQPAGTYSAKMYVFEDHIPEQWRDWVYYYRGLGFNTFGDNDGILNTTITGTATDVRMMPEGRSDPTFTVKATVREARMTNGQTPGSYPVIDVRAPNAPQFGANVWPAAIMDAQTGNVNMFWTSNRPDNNQPFPAGFNSDVPWYLVHTKLNSVSGNAGAPYGFFRDWRFENVNMTPTRWWDPLANQALYPDPANVNTAFPSQASDLVAPNLNSPLVPGRIVPESVRHGAPALTQDELLAQNSPTLWLFWQAAAYKNENAGGQSASLDTRTMYVPLQNGAPANAAPFSFLNDPALPKYSPKPLVIRVGNQSYGYLFWYGGAQGRSRLYYNINDTNLTQPNNWSKDTLLPAPGNLQAQSDPVPIHRRQIFTTYFNPAGETLDAIDLIYTGVLSNRRQPETLLTRYAIRQNGRLSVMPLTPVDSETLVREAASQTWTSRDMAWIYRDPATRAFVTQNPPYNGDSPWIRIFVFDRAGNSRGGLVNGQPRQINTGAPTFDNATGFLHFNSLLGGQLIVDPQGGRVTFTGVAPQTTDRVTLQYIPQTMRLNLTRNESGVIPATVGGSVPLNDPGFAPKPHVPSPGSNTNPAAFIDRMLNPRPENLVQGSAPNNQAPPITRMWLFYRKSGTNTSSTGGIYYKTMRLMVRLPRGVLRDLNPMTGQYTIGNNLTITGNADPVEVDWVRGRVYFTERDEGKTVQITFNYARNNGQPVSSTAQYRVGWGDEISSAVNPGDQPTSEAALPTDATVNEGQISAFKDVFADKVWVFWSSTRSGTTDLYYMTISPTLYPQQAQ